MAIGYHEGDVGSRYGEREELVGDLGAVQRWDEITQPVTDIATVRKIIRYCEN
jgi:hypothetical protein